MKKWIAILIIVLMASFTSQSMALDIGIGAGTGYMLQKSENAAFSYNGTFDIPIVTKTDSSYAIYTYVDYLYADRENDDETITEFSVLRTMFMYERNIYKTLNLGLGTGMWKFIESEGADNEYPALRLKIAACLWGVQGSITGDIVRVNNASDIYHVALNINPF